MDARLSTALVIASAVMLASFGADAACTASHPSDCPAVNFNVVPDITKQVIAARPNSAQIKLSPVVQPEAVPYSGPTLGASTMVRRAPEIGYRWSLE